MYVMHKFCAIGAGGCPVATGDTAATIAPPPGTRTSGTGAVRLWLRQAVGMSDEPLSNQETVEISDVIFIFTARVHVHGLCERVFCIYCEYAEDAFIYFEYIEAAVTPILYTRAVKFVLHHGVTPGTFEDSSRKVSDMMKIRV